MLKNTLKLIQKIKQKLPFEAKIILYADNNDLIIELKTNNNTKPILYFESIYIRQMNLDLEETFIDDFVIRTIAFYNQNTLDHMFL